jgi:hypothetical protein
MVGRGDGRPERCSRGPAISWKQFVNDVYLCLRVGVCAVLGGLFVCRRVALVAVKLPHPSYPIPPTTLSPFLHVSPPSQLERAMAAECGAGVWVNTGNALAF